LAILLGSLGMVPDLEEQAGNLEAGMKSDAAERFEHLFYDLINPEAI